MLSTHMEDLQNCIQWAQYQQDVDVLCLARVRMQALEKCVGQLPAPEQQRAYRQIDAMLPMEWPFWMELCRYEDQLGQQQSLH